MTIKHYEVQTRTIADGWINTWHENDEPLVFATEYAARKAISEFFDDLETANMAHQYDRSDYRVQAIHFDDLVTIDEGDEPEAIARKLQASLSTVELRDLIDELVEVYEPTDDMRERGESLWPDCIHEDCK